MYLVYLLYIQDFQCATLWLALTSHLAHAGGRYLAGALAAYTRPPMARLAAAWPSDARMALTCAGIRFRVPGDAATFLGAGGLTAVAQLFARQPALVEPAFGCIRSSLSEQVPRSPHSSVVVLFNHVSSNIALSIACPCKKCILTCLNITLLHQQKQCPAGLASGQCHPNDGPPAAA